MERSVEDAIKRNNHITELRDAAKYGQEVVDLVQADMDYGLTVEQTKLYLKRNLKFPQMKMISMCLRKGASDAFVELVTKYNMDGHQIQVAMEFFEKGVTLENIETVFAKDETPANMRKTFEAMLEKVKEVRSSSEVAPEYVQGLVKQIEEAVAKIQYQEERYDELNKKLKVFENAIFTSLSSNVSIRFCIFSISFFFSSICSRSLAIVALALFTCSCWLLSSASVSPNFFTRPS